MYPEAMTNRGASNRALASWLVGVAAVVATVVVLPWGSASASAPSPAVELKADDYVAGATTWLNTGTLGSSANITTATGGMARTSSGPSAVVFNGKESSNSDRVTGTLGNGSRTAVTVEMWLKLGDLGSAQNPAGSTLFSWAQNPNAASYNVYHFSDGTVGDRLGFNNFQGENYGFDSSSLVGSWHHFLFVMSTSVTASDQKIYVDGVAQALTCAPPGTPPHACSDAAGARSIPANGNFVIMDNSYSSNTWNAKGDVGLVRIYESALSASDAAAVYAASAGGFQGTTTAAPTTAAPTTAAPTTAAPTTAVPTTGSATTSPSATPTTTSGGGSAGAGGSAATTTTTFGGGLPVTGGGNSLLIPVLVLLVAGVVLLRSRPRLKS